MAETQSCVLEPRNKYLVFAIVFFLLYSICYCLHLYFLLSLHLLFIFCIISTCHFLLSKLRRQLCISTHCLEEYKGKVLEPFIGNLASLFDLSQLFASFILIVAFQHLISTTPIHLPLGVLSSITKTTDVRCVCVCVYS